MINILNDFHEEMELLKLYIDFQDKSYRNQYRKEKKDPNSDLSSLNISKIKQFDFNSHIISIYGAYERFTERLLVKYLSDLCSITNNYEFLPKEIQDNNLKKTFGIMKYLGSRKTREISAEKLIETLHKNINENCSQINIEAFKNHTSNFRISVIDIYFSEIGIKNISSLIRQYEPLKGYLSNDISDFAIQKNSVIFQILEHLCDLRNDIAHGVDNVQLIHKTILFDYIDFMKIFTESLYELINDNYLSKIYSQNEHEIEAIDIFNNSILCFDTKGSLITKNSKILVNSKNSYPNFFTASISNIRYNEVDIEKTELNNAIKIGVLVDRKIKNSMKFKLII
tara:strand:- start:353 stop:1372 length:1020 start_codon:yes stop_codon:yes gene_type:complete